MGHYAVRKLETQSFMNFAAGAPSTVVRSWRLSGPKGEVYLVDKNGQTTPLEFWDEDVALDWCEAMNGAHERRTAAPPSQEGPPSPHTPGGG